ncbi:amidase family protein, partial [Aliarcobacter butzleri]
DAAILYDIITGYDPMDSASANIYYEAVPPKLDSDKKLTIAVIDNFVSQASPAIPKAFQKAVNALEEAGHKSIHKNMLDTQKIDSTYYIVA